MILAVSPVIIRLPKLKTTIAPHKVAPAMLPSPVREAAAGLPYVRVSFTNPAVHFGGPQGARVKDFRAIVVFASCTLTSELQTIITSELQVTITL